MATLDVSKCSAFMPTGADLTVTAPDGNTYTAIMDVWWGVPYNSTVLTVTEVGATVLLMEAGSHLKRASGEFVQVGTTDFVRITQA